MRFNVPVRHCSGSGKTKRKNSYPENSGYPPGKREPGPRRLISTGCGGAQKI
uniref:Uncharacterized protein n=1 Tax=Anopheles minimus TaxID=112268 RepID=A0A182WP79_9DIPT